MSPSQQPRKGENSFPVWAPPRSLAATRGITKRHSNRLTAFEKAQVIEAPHSLALMGTPTTYCFLFLRVLRWFTSPGIASLSFLRHSNRLTAFEKARND